MLVDDQLQDVQRPACKGESVEIDFEQVGGSGRVVLVENRSAGGQFNNSGSDVYGALKSYRECFDAIRATPTQDNVQDARDATLKRSHIVNPAYGGHTVADMRVADLRKELDDRGLDKTGNKAVFVVRFAKLCLSRRRVCVVLHSFCNFSSRHWLPRGNRVEGE